MAHVTWAPRAFADLENLLDYIARSEPATARRFGQKLLDRIESLAVFPDTDRVGVKLMDAGYQEARSMACWDGVDVDTKA